jgi:hypothetical protein
VLRTVESALLLLPGDKARDRAEALAMRAEALSGLGRRDDARSAWNVAAQRFDEIGDKKSAAAALARLQGPPEEGSAPAEGDGREAAVAVAAPETQDTNLAANGTGA